MNMHGVLAWNRSLERSSDKAYRRRMRARAERTREFAHDTPAALIEKLPRLPFWVAAVVVLERAATLADRAAAELTRAQFVAACSESFATRTAAWVSADEAEDHEIDAVTYASLIGLMEDNLGGEAFAAWCKRCSARWQGRLAASIAARAVGLHYLTRSDLGPWAPAGGSLDYKGPGYQRPNDDPQALAYECEFVLRHGKDLALTEDQMAQWIIELQSKPTWNEWETFGDGWELLCAHARVDASELPSLFALAPDELDQRGRDDLPRLNAAIEQMCRDDWDRDPLMQRIHELCRQGGSASFWVHQKLPPASAFTDPARALALLGEIVSAWVATGSRRGLDSDVSGLRLDALLALGGTLEVALDVAPDGPSILDLGEPGYKRGEFFAKRAERCLERLGTEETLAALERALGVAPMNATSGMVCALYQIRSLLVTLAQDATGSDEDVVRRVLRLLSLARMIDTRGYESFLTESRLDVFPRQSEQWEGTLRWTLFRTMLASGDDSAPLTFLQDCGPAGAEVLLRETAAGLRSGNLVLPRRLTERLPALFVAPGRGAARTHPLVGDRAGAILALASIAGQESNEDAARRVFRFLREAWWEAPTVSVNPYLRILDDQYPLVVDWIAGRWGVAPFEGMVRDLRIRARMKVKPSKR